MYRLGRTRTESRCVTIGVKILAKSAFDLQRRATPPRMVSNYRILKGCIMTDEEKPLVDLEVGSHFDSPPTSGSIRVV